ncbi:MAG: dipeptidyl peptidase 3, partial [Muribaculaceae bacterium]|nr:dipeptidyl peptidase 3 [Muribaculaceae bacterium]
MNHFKQAAISFCAAAISIQAMNSKDTGNFNYIVDKFADIEVLRYQVPGFEELTPNQRKLVYYLTEAALAGRDILWDQNGKYNLEIRQLLENIYTRYTGDRNSADFKAFEKYLKQVWFGNGIHHHYSMDKFVPEFTREFFDAQVALLPADSRPANLDILADVIFNPATMPKKVNQAEGQDLILTSANNLYEEGITQKEVEDYFAAIKDTTDLTPISYGLNTRITRDKSGNLVEQPYKSGGLYGAAIDRIILNLEKAARYAENDHQKEIIAALVKYYRTGNLRDFDTYSILWTGDTESQVDFINGFIESYDDPLGMTGAWESIVNFKNNEASHRTEVLSNNAQWFEDRSPVDPRFRKPEVKGVSAKVITAAILAGDSYPSTPIGIN